MRGMGQIAELCEIAEPDVAAITNVGPVHLELLGTIEAIAEAKAEILAGLGDDGRAVLPADAEALEPHLADGLATITFGAGGDVFARDRESRRAHGLRATIVTPAGRGGSSSSPFDRAPQPRQRGLRGRDRRRARRPGRPRWRVGRRAYPSPGCGASGSSSPEAPCWSTTATTPTRSRCTRRSTTSRRSRSTGRRIAVLGGMAELGPDGPGYHREAGGARPQPGDRADRRRRRARPRLRRRRVGRRPDGGRGELVAGMLGDGRRDPGQGLALGRARGLRRGAAATAGPRS